MAKGLLDGGSGAVSLEDLKEDHPVLKKTATAPPEPAPAAEPQPTEPKPEEPKVETPKVEPTPVEPKVETPPEPEAPVVKEPEEPKAPTPVEQMQQSGLNLEFLKELTGKAFESEDQVKEALTKQTMESEYDELQTQYKDLDEKYSLLTEQLDPSKYFSSEEAMKLEMFKKENPKKDASIAQKVFSTDDLNSVDDLEMVKMGRKFKNPKLPGTEKDLEVAIMEELGIEEDSPRSEWSTTAQIRLANMASDYREQFDTIKEGVQLPERIDIDGLHAERKQASEEVKTKLVEDWTKNADDLLKTFDKIKLPVGKPEEGEDQQFFEWDLGEAPKAEIESLKGHYITNGIEYDDLTKESFNKALEMSQLSKNLPQIMKQYGEDIVAREAEKHLKETHNPEPLKDAERPKSDADADRIKERTEWASTGGASVRQKPLFNQT